jgi:hypothetical protein
MIPQLTTTSPMRKSRIAMMVSMELASWTTTTREKQLQEHLVGGGEMWTRTLGGDWLGQMLFFTRLLNRAIKRLAHLSSTRCHKLTSSQ